MRPSRCSRVIKLDKTPAFLISQLGWTKDNVDSMVKAVDPSTLQITIGPNFAPSLVLALMSSIVGSVVEKAVAMEHDQGGDLGNGWLKTHSAGSGPFSLRAWKANESVVLDANPTYREGAPPLKRVVIRHVPEPAAQRLLIEKGDADIARDLTPDQIASIAGNKDVKIVASPQATLHYVGLNVKAAAARQPEGARTPCTTSSTTTAWPIRSSRARIRSTRPSGRRASGPRSTRTPSPSIPPRPSSCWPRPAIRTASRSRSMPRIPRPTPTWPSRSRPAWRRAASR